MKRFLLGIIFTLLIFNPSHTPQAKVTGRCDNCHTMHSSQGGAAPLAWEDKGWAQGTTRKCLLVGSCLGCHAQSSSGANIVNDIPQVRHGGADLAAGNFNYIAGTDDDKGHNVLSIDQEGNALMFPPPGDQHSTGITQTGNTALTCAGAYGCHGDRSVSGNIESMKGAHHTDDTVLKFGHIDEAQQAPTTGSTGEKVGLSYRFLMGVKGGEDSDWQATTSYLDDHNEYKGATTMGRSDPTSPANNTISGLCAECHGYYHGTGSDECTGAWPWVKHPTDATLPVTGLMGEYSAYTTYSLTAPVARTAIPDSPNGTVTPSGDADDIVMCLSCHRAHASSNFKIMRWDYKSTTLSTALSGCGVCHTSKY